MIIDVHGHVSAPERLYAYKANLLAHRGAHGRGGVAVTDDELRAAVVDEVGASVRDVAPGPPRRAPESTCS